MTGRILIALCLLLLAAPAMAVMHPDEKLRDPALEARAMALTRTLRCVTCQNESIEDSNADMARTLRLSVRRQILEGRSDAQITRFLRERYGDYILLDPPFMPRTWALWLAPVIALAAGGALAALSFRRRPLRRRGRP